MTANQKKTAQPCPCCRNKAALNAKGVIAAHDDNMGAQCVATGTRYQDYPLKPGKGQPVARKGKR